MDSRAAGAQQIVVAGASRQTAARGLERWWSGPWGKRVCLHSLVRNSPGHVALRVFCVVACPILRDGLAITSRWSAASQRRLHGFYRRSIIDVDRNMPRGDSHTPLDAVGGQT